MDKEKLFCLMENYRLIRMLANKNDIDLDELFNKSFPSEYYFIYKPIFDDNYKKAIVKVSTAFAHGCNWIYNYKFNEEKKWVIY